MFKLSKGFTIVELIIVIAIIAVLAAIMIANVSQYVGKSRDTSVKGEIHQLATAITDYVVTNGSGSSVCQSAAAKKIGNAIKAISPNYEFSCYDFYEGYHIASAKRPNLASIMLPVAQASVGPPPPPPVINPDCSPISWYTVVKGLKISTSGCWCSDSYGSIVDSCGNWDVCACQ